MYFQALATDYDGTLAKDSHVAPTVLQACRALRESGRKLILVTGRELPQLQSVFPAFDLCDEIVAENGALLYTPASDREEILSPALPNEFLDEMRRRDVTPCSLGRVIFATWRPQETVVLEVIQQLGLDCQIIFNKRAVMVLPSGVNKATGLDSALRALEVSPQRVVGVGDAENDHAFLDACGVAAAVENALPSLKSRCDVVTRGDHGRGVVELIERLLQDDLRELREQSQSTGRSRIEPDGQ